MRQISFVALLCMSAALGFIVTLRLLDEADKRPEGEPVDVDLKFASHAIQPGTLRAGWGRPEKWGVWAVAGQAVVIAEVFDAGRGDLALIIEGRGHPSLGDQETTVNVAVNGVEIGAWQLTAQISPNFGRFIVPEAAASRQYPMQVVFSAERPVLGLTRIILRDVSQLSDLSGYVDNCQGGHIRGWAQSGPLPAPVLVRRNGRVAPMTLRTVVRPDLTARGLRAEAGFDITLRDFSGSGESIEVVFPNGRPLKNSHCRAS